jgi:hypothetical protein
LMVVVVVDIRSDLWENNGRGECPERTKICDDSFQLTFLPFILFGLPINNPINNTFPIIQLYMFIKSIH